MPNLPVDISPDAPYRAAHPLCAECGAEVCIAGISCPSCKLDTPAGICMQPGESCPDYVCGTACRVSWERIEAEKRAAEGPGLASTILDNLFTGGVIAVPPQRVNESAVPVAVPEDEHTERLPVAVSKRPGVPASLVALLCESLSVRAGESLTPEVIEERARNAAMAVLGEFEVRRRVSEEAA